MTPEQRGRLLVRLADLIEQHADTLAAIETLDVGKALSLAKMDVTFVIGLFRYYGGWADKVVGKVIDTGTDAFSYTRQEPVSIIALEAPCWCWWTIYANEL